MHTMMKDGMGFHWVRPRTELVLPLKTLESVMLDYTPEGALKLSLIHLILDQQLPFSLQRSRKVGEE